jgi:hypothetical protein
LGQALHQNKIKKVSHRVNNCLDGRKLSGQKRRLAGEARLVLAKIHSKFLVAFVCTATMSILAQASFAQGPTSQNVDRAQLLQDQTNISQGVVVTINSAQQADVFTNHPNYFGFGGTGTAATTGTFGGVGAKNPQPLANAPPLGAPDQGP